jgi:hypothetical protein
VLTRKLHRLNLSVTRSVAEERRVAYPPKGLFLRPEATIIPRSGRPRFLASYRRRRQKIASGHDSTVAGEQGGNRDRIRMACEVAGVKYGKDLVVNLG